MVEPPIDEPQWDVFVSYASEDRQALVEPLATLLVGMGLRVWWDQFELKVGDSLIEKITLGLSRSRYGVVVLSRDFLAKPWPQYELQGLTARDIVGDRSSFPSGTTSATTTSYGSTLLSHRRSPEVHTYRPPSPAQRLGRCAPGAVGGRTP
jgi:hypothetical protein